MPPNRKEVASMIRTLSSEKLAGFVRTAKFAPLTGGGRAAVVAPAPLKREEEQAAAMRALDVAEEPRVEHQQPRRHEEVKDAKPSASSDASHEDMAVEEERRSQSQVGGEEKEEIEADKYTYWTWPQLSPRPDADAEMAEAEDQVRTHGTKWSEELARRREILVTILAEERARESVSAANIESHLKEDARKRSREYIVAKIVEEEMAREAVCLGKIEASLLRDAEKRRAKDQVVIRNEEKISEEGGGEGYWDWDGEKEASSARADDVFGVTHIEEMLTKASAQIRVHSQVGLRQASRDEESSSAGRNYWHWKTLTKDEEKRRIIESILEDERARLVLSADHVESNLRREAETPVTAHAEGCRGGRTEPPPEVGEDYWSWSVDARKSASPSVEERPPVAPHDSSSYWDWSPRLNDKEVRRMAVDTMLREEEVRKMLSADWLVENLKADTWRRAKEEVDAWYHRVDTEARRAEGGAEEAESYWDM